MKTKSGICYRIEWLHNYQWRVEANGGGTFETFAEAKRAQKSADYKNVKTRIIKMLATKAVRP